MGNLVLQQSNENIGRQSLKSDVIIAEGETE
jgi:hypothetical protein